MNKKDKFGINSKKDFKEYFVTIIISMIVTFAICLGLQLELMFRSEQNVNRKELSVENLSKFWTIEGLEKQLQVTPDDYILNLKLAVLYESLNKLDKANTYYKNALKLSARSNLAIYSYAMFCARNELYVFAATLAEELIGANKKTYLYKANIFEQLGKSFDAKDNIPASVNSYQIAYKYAKSVGDVKYLNSIKKQYANEYIKLADLNVKNKDIEQAICDLNNSLKIRKTPLANYKLGLIYLNSNQQKAEKYIYQAMSEDIFMINPYIYNSLVQNLMQEAKILNKQSVYNFYNLRLVRFKNKLMNSYLYKNQIIIDNSTLVSTKSFLKKPQKYLVFQIKNNTQNEIKDLYLKAELFINGQKYTAQKKIINQVHPLEAYDNLIYENYVLPDEIEFNNLNQNNDIFVKYYAKRCENAPWLLVKIDFINI